MSIAPTHRALEAGAGAGTTGRLTAQLDLLTPSESQLSPRLTDLVVDALGVAVAGRGQPVSVAAASIVGSSRTLWDRAWLHGVQMHALDFDDTHEASLCHTAVALLPGLLAAALERSLPATRLLQAHLFGVRVVDFLAPLGPRFNEMGLHSTGLVGTLAAAAASSWLLDGDPGVSAAAMEFAALTASGLGAAFGTDAKPIQAARTTEAGLRAALLAGAGVGPPHGAALGPRGLVALWLGEEVIDTLPWETMAPEAVSQVALKPYPSCFLTHSTIDAILWIRDQLGIRDVADVALVEVVAHPVAIALADKTALRTATDAKFSLRYCAREALLRGVPVVGSFADHVWREVMADREGWSRWVDRVEVRADRDLPRVGARVVLRTVDGRTCAREVMAPHGSAADPLTATEVDDKFRANCAGAMSDAQVEAALAGVRGLAGVADLGDLTVFCELLPQVEQPTP
ncbi:MAG TPA: MmgE/PrpD family protein [Candidatus Dormibacteraeota bacterium]|nr:MmgE/PrpD family protein [Candidatus Dormibacteraeota bacterium]